MRGSHRIAAVSSLVAGLLLAGAVVSWLAAPRSQLTLLLLFLAVLAALPAAALVLRWVWRRLTYRVGVRLFLSYLLIGLTPFAICAAAGLVAGYVLVGEYAASRVRTEMGRLDDRIAAEAADAVAELAAGRPERARRLLAAAEPSGMCAEWLLADAAREWRSDGAAMLATPRWVGEGGWQGEVVGGDAVFRAAVARRDAIVAAVLVPLDLSNARAFPAASWYEVRFLSDLATAARGAATHTVTVAEHGRGDGGSEFRVNGRPVPESEIERGWLSPSRGGGTRWARIRTLWLLPAGKPRDLETGEAREHALLLTMIKLSPRGALDDLIGGGEHLRSDIKGVAAVVGAFLAAVYLIAVGFAALMIVRVTRAAARLTRGAAAVAGGNLDYRIPVKRRDQLGDLAIAFNTMAAAVRSMLAQVAEKERMAREVELAREIQSSLLPPAELVVGPLAVWAHFRPATEVGGDYYDLFPLPSHGLMAAIGDVAGHGLPTGLLMAMVKSAVAALVEEGYRGGELLARLNRLLLAQPLKQRMVSLALAEADAARGEVTITSAGHQPGLLLAAEGPALEVLLSSLPLGHRWPDGPTARTMPFAPGARLLLYSDGLVEARDASGTPFGHGALRATLEAQRTADGPELIRALLASLDAHLGGEALADDLTIVLIENLPAAAG